MMPLLWATPILVSMAVPVPQPPVDATRSPTIRGYTCTAVPRARRRRAFQGLRVQLGADGRSGIFHGTAILDAEHRVLVLSNRAYVDIHTVKNGPGEVRDQWRPLDAAAAARLMDALLAEHGGRERQVATGSCHAP
jgi:hypothetical protein